MTTEAPEYGQYDYDEGDERTVRDYLAIARRRKWYIIIPIVVAVGASLAVSLSAVKMYRSQSSVLVQAAPVPGTVMSESAMSPRTLNNELLRAQGVQLQEEARKVAGPEPTLSVGLAQDKDADLFVFKATSDSPVDAADAANAYADVYVESRKAALAADFDSQAAVLTQQRDRAQKDLDAAGNSNSDAALEIRRTVADYQSKIDDVETAAKFAAESGAQVVNVAEVPDAPYSPQPIRNALLALFLGLFVGTIAAFARDTLDQRVRTVADLERATDIPVLAVIGRLKRWGKRSETHVVMLEDASSPQAESYRALRTKIQFRRVDHPLKTLLVTSPRPGDGKTTTSTNLAVAFATAGERTLLVDMDLRRPRMHKFFPVDNSVGVSNVLAGDDINSAVHALPTVPDLWLLPAGPVRDDASELLSDERVEQLLATLAERFETVIIDSAPVLAVSDALAITRASDGVLLVTSAGSTDQRQARDATEQLADVQAPVLGAVLNNFSAKESGYTYSYSYGDYGAERSNGDDSKSSRAEKKQAKKSKKDDKKSRRAKRKNGDDGSNVLVATGLPDALDSGSDGSGSTGSDDATSLAINGSTVLEAMPDGSIPTPDVDVAVDATVDDLRLSFEPSGDAAEHDESDGDGDAVDGYERPESDELAEEFQVTELEAEQFEVDQAVVDQPVDGELVDVQHVDPQPVDVQPVDVQSVDPQPVDRAANDVSPTAPAEQTNGADAGPAVGDGADSVTGRRGVFVTLDIPLTNGAPEPAPAPEPPQPAASPPSPPPAPEPAPQPTGSAAVTPSGEGVEHVRDQVQAAQTALLQAETLANEQAALSRSVQRAAAARDEAERVAAEYTEMARAAAERAAQALAAAEEAAADHALAEQLAAERRATEQSALANAAAEQASAAQLAAERAALDLTDAERTVADHLAVARLAREAAVERAVSARAAAERVARSQHLSLDELLGGDGGDSLPLPPLTATGANTAPLPTGEVYEAGQLTALERATTHEERLLAVRAELRQARADHHAERRAGVEQGIAPTQTHVAIADEADDTAGLGYETDEWDEEWSEDGEWSEEWDDEEIDDEDVDEEPEPAPKKKTTRKSPAKKPAAKKSTRKSPAKKSTRKSPAKKTTAKKTAAKKTAAKKTAAKKSSSARSARR